MGQSCNRFLNSTPSLQILRTTEHGDPVHALRGGVNPTHLLGLLGLQVSETNSPPSAKLSVLSDSNSPWSQAKVFHIICHLSTFKLMMPGTELRISCMHSFAIELQPFPWCCSHCREWHKCHVYNVVLPRGILNISKSMTTQVSLMGFSE